MSMQFETRKIVTGVESRISTKTNKPYTLISYLNDNGSTFSTMAECPIPQDLKQLDIVKVQFQVDAGKYTSLKTISIEKVAQARAS